MLGRCKRALARAAPASSKKITGTRGTGDRMRRFMLMLSFDSPPPHWWLTPGGANATRLSNLPYSRRQVSVTHSLRSGFWLFYCLTRGSATSSLHPALKAAVPERDSNFRSLRSPIKSIYVAFLMKPTRNFGSLITLACFDEHIHQQI